MNIRLFQVKGSGNFPFEMLGFDQCWPASQVHADAIRMSCPTVADERSITLATREPGAPTPRRWAEYHWQVIKPPTY